MTQTIAIIAPSSVPFQIGGAEKFWWGLHRALSTWSDAAVELLKIPCREDSFFDLIDAYRRFSELDLSHFDMVVSTKYPAWMIRHPRHVVYMQHTLRGLYDTYHFTGLPERLDPVPAALRDLILLARTPAPTRDDLARAFDMLDHLRARTDIPPQYLAFPAPLIREVVHFFDRAALAPSQVSAYATISDTVRRRGYLPPGVETLVLPHPSDIPALPPEPGRYIFTASRLTSMKRLRLIIEAMRHVSADIPLKIAGTGPEMEHLKALAADDPRVEFLGHVPDAELPALYAGALFVPFVPYDEDYGLITVEAMHTAKPVVTVSDAGGVCELVEDGRTGLCTEPEPEALGAAMQRLADDPALAERLGLAARERVRDITWKNVCRKLLFHAAQAATRNTDTARRRILVCGTFSASAPSGGGRRLYHVCKTLARRHDVLLICYGAQTQQGVQTRELLPHFRELRLSWPQRALDEADALRARCGGASVDDLALMRTCGEDAGLHDALRMQGENALCAVATPWLLPALQRALPQTPLLYDAHNVESDMKAAVLGDRCPELLREVFAMERECVRTARIVLACSREDAARFATCYDLPAEKCRILPNGCDGADTGFASARERRALRRRLLYPDVPLALFVGSGHKPNIEALSLIRDMAGELPDVQFLVVGSVGTQAEVRDAPRPANVHLTGIVSEAVKKILLHAADVGLNPVISGSGTNLKLVEYAAAGLETVSTPFGMRGIDEPLEPCVHACAPEEFPRMIRRILTQPSDSRELEATARRIAARYDWRAVMQVLEKAVAELE